MVKWNIDASRMDASAVTSIICRDNKGNFIETIKKAAWGLSYPYSGNSSDSRSHQDLSPEGNIHYHCGK